VLTGVSQEMGLLVPDDRPQLSIASFAAPTAKVPIRAQLQVSNTVAIGMSRFYHWKY
jgi:hypothetical protein